ncbi:AraC-type DNA-binding protein [Pseudomonas punonensis]|uniref:AraC-type DNA-binding protein n=1 Tax=Phytopseudomonas punonensis TaxID=1220495 RepID=A0A1M6YWR8_9GAMM|nr:AraC-type DNA-binding protein [Pseudomonas punonensis]
MAHYRQESGINTRPATAGPALVYLHVPLIKTATKPHSELVRQVAQLIEELLVDGATLEQVADRMHMPVRRLREQLSQADVRFNEMLTNSRRNLAERLLLDTDKRIELIAERIGFSEPSTFCRAFKRWVGVTPAEFRRRGRLSAGDRSAS